LLTGSYQSGGLWATNDAPVDSTAIPPSQTAYCAILQPGITVVSRPHGGNGTLYINGVAQTVQAINTANIDFADSNRPLVGGLIAAVGMRVLCSLIIASTGRR
jgi:hypothetical protein